MFYLKNLHTSLLTLKEPNLNTNNIFFYRGKKSISVDFSAEEISSDDSLVLLDKLEREHKLIRYFSKLFQIRAIPFISNPIRQETFKATRINTNVGL